MKSFPYIFLLILFYSCSPAKQIGKSARQNILNSEALATAHIGISVYDPSSKKYLYNYQGDKYFVPASNTKIPTCYAAMKYLGDSLVGIKYNEVDDSTVVIQGMGDPSFLHSDYLNNPVFDFLKKYRSIKIINPDFDDYLGAGWGWNDYLEYYLAQRSAFPFHGNTVMVNWLDDNTLSFLPSFFKEHSSINENLPGGYKVYRPWDTNDFTFTKGRTKHSEIPFRPDEKTLVSLLQDTLQTNVETIEDFNGTLTKIIHSQPTDSLLKPMMHRSDNFYAEQSLLMVSEKLLGVMSDRKIIDTLLKTDYKLMPQKPSWVDGSGLSRYDLFSPKDFIFILNKMKNDFGMDRIKNILPTGGTGTISNYYLQDSGYIFVKTGTLNGVVALSGFLYTKKNKLLLFSVLVNNHRSSATNIRKGIEKFIQDLRDNY